MKKEEVKACKTMADVIKEAIEDAEECNIFSKDEDGAYTHNTMVFLHKIEHVMNLLSEAWENESLKWRYW